MMPSRSCRDAATIAGGEAVVDHIDANMEVFSTREMSGDSSRDSEPRGKENLMTR